MGRCCASTYALPSLRAQARQSGAALCANRLTFNDSGEGIRSPSRGAFRPRFACVSPSSEDGGRREDRVAAAPGAPAPEKLREGRVTTGTGGDTPAFPAQWFYGLYVLSPVSLALPPSLSRSFSAIRENLAPAWACQDHTTSPSVKRAARQSAPPRPPHPHLTSRDDRDTPLRKRGGMSKGYD